MSEDKYWNTERFQALRMQTDPLADQVIQKIIESNSTEGINTLFNQLRENDDISKVDFHSEVKNYFEQTAVLPEWANQDLIKIGQKVFSKFGPEISLCLLTKSLPEAYACSKGAKVLYATGRLTEQDGNLKVFTRRLMETSQFVMYVNEIGGLEPNGKGVITAQKVRLIHAAIRYYLKRHRWNNDAFGEPINQQDMAGTLQSFSALTLQGLDVLNLNLSEEEKQGYYHSWRVVGHIMGVKEELNPENYKDGLALGTAILNDQMAPSSEGTELTQAVMKFMSDMIPGKMFDLAPEALIRHLVGDQIADILKLDSKLNLIDKMMPNLIAEILDKVDKTADSNRVVEKIFDHVKAHFLQHMLNHFNHNKQVKFYIPPNLRSDWNLD